MLSGERKKRSVSQVATGEGGGAMKNYGVEMC